MSDPFVSSYDEQIRAAFDHALGEMPTDHSKLICKVTDDICQEIHDQIRDKFVEYFFENIKDDICRKAAAVAKSMIISALAGDDKEIRHLFGFNDHYIRWAWPPNELPTQWRLIEAIAARRPDLFTDERLKQNEREIELLRQRNEKLQNDNAAYFIENAKLRGHY
jgi:hypothetical protein